MTVTAPLAVHAGYNMQFDNNFVFGLEGDIDYADLTKSHTSPAHNFTSNWQGSVRAKAGYAVADFLPYVAGGIAVSNPQLSGFEGERKTLVGWTAGGGIEYAMDKHRLVRGDLRYTDFGKQGFPFADGMTLKVRFNKGLIHIGVEL